MTLAMAEESLIQIIKEPLRFDAVVRHRTEWRRFIVEAHWLLGDDPKRLNKPSKRIILLFPVNIAEDFRELGPREIRIVRERLSCFLREQLALFDASHDESPGFEPVERWPVPVSLFHDLVG
jgi:hypothetical protein